MLWNYTPDPDPALLAHMEATLNQKVPFPPVLARLMVQRGNHTPDQAKEFLQPETGQLHPPQMLMGMDRSVARILQAISRDEKMLIYGDYDVDGTSSVALMKLFFADWGLEVPFYIPDRFSEGYGISYEGVDEANRQGVTLMITLDCGAKALDKIGYARQRGIDVVVVDHHTLGSEAPPCHSMVNPRQPGCTYPFKELPACGLALKLAQALAARLPELAPRVTPIAGYDVLERYADLVALAIASDIVPLLGENRVIASLGLRKLRQNPLPGIAALKALAGPDREWTIEDLVFFIGPRINSAGRLYSASEAVELLMGKSNKISKLAEDLHQYNEERKELEALIHSEALKLLETDPTEAARSCTVLWKDDWSKGVIGIVASRLIERIHRPTILLTLSNGKYVGSGRSVPGFDLYAALDACAEHLVQFGGHKYAAGLTLDAEQLQPFKEALDAYIAAHIQPEQKVPVLEVCGDLPLDAVNERFVRQMRLFGPFGPENMEPVFVAKGVEVRDMRILKGAHLRLELRQGGTQLEAIGFGLAERWHQVNAKTIDIAYQPGFKTYRGTTSIQLRIKDIRKAQGQ